MAEALSKKELSDARAISAAQALRVWTFYSHKLVESWTEDHQAVPSMNV
jgi:hypothetical protein